MTFSRLSARVTKPLPVPVCVIDSIEFVLSTAWYRIQNTFRQTQSPCVTPPPSVFRVQNVNCGRSRLQLNSPMNSVSSTEDIKPPLGINGVMKVPAQPSGTVLSLTKHICAICGDRSSGEWRSTQHPTPATQSERRRKIFQIFLFVPLFLFYFYLKNKK